VRILADTSIVRSRWSPETEAPEPFAGLSPIDAVPARSSRPGVTFADADPKIALLVRRPACWLFE
jgi:hypothetical protein